MRFHSKYHNKNHHTEPTDGYPDSASDPIASTENPFKGDFILDGSLNAETAVFSNKLSNLEVDNITINNPITSLDVTGDIVVGGIINGDGAGLINITATSLGNFDSSDFQLISQKDQNGGYLGITQGGGILGIETAQIYNLTDLITINGTSITNYLTTDNFGNQTNLVPPNSLTDGAPVWDGGGNLNINSTKIKNYQGAAGFGNLAAIELGLDNGEGDDPDLHGSYFDFHASHNISSNANNNLVANDYAARIIRYGTGPDSNGLTLDRAGQLRIQQTGDHHSNKLVLATSQQVDEDNLIDKGVLTIEQNGTIDLNGVQIYTGDNLGLMKVGNTVLGGDDYPFLILESAEDGASISLQSGPDDENGAQSDAYHKAEGHHFLPSKTQLEDAGYVTPDPKNNIAGSDSADYAYVTIGGEHNERSLSIWGIGQQTEDPVQDFDLATKRYVDANAGEGTGGSKSPIWVAYHDYDGSIILDPNSWDTNDDGNRPYDWISRGNLNSVHDNSFKNVTNYSIKVYVPTTVTRNFKVKSNDIYRIFKDSTEIFVNTSASLFSATDESIDLPAGTYYITFRTEDYNGNYYQHVSWDHGGLIDYHTVFPLTPQPGDALWITSY